MTTNSRSAALLASLLMMMIPPTTTAGAAEVVELPAPAGIASGAGYGSAVAIAADVAAVGAPRGVAGGAVAMLERRADGGWDTLPTVTPSGGGSGDGFGAALAMGEGRLAIAAPGDHAVHLLAQRADGRWLEEDVVRRPGGTSDDEFGASVAIGGGCILAVGAPGADHGRGAVEVFGRANGTTRWIRLATLHSDAPEDGGEFGRSIAMYSADWVAVGAPGEAATGRVHVFANENTDFIATSARAWTHRVMLAPPAGNAGERFGAAVAMLGQNVFVGAPLHDLVEGGRTDAGAGAVYDFAYSPVPRTWSMAAMAFSPDHAPGDHFGSAVACCAGLVTVGAPAADLVGTDSGAVYFFALNTGVALVPASTPRLIASASQPGALLGSAVALDQHPLGRAGLVNDALVGGAAGALFDGDTQAESGVYRQMPMIERVTATTAGDSTVVAFDATASGSPTAPVSPADLWSAWSFGDGSPTTYQQPGASATHRYPADGLFLAWIQLWDESGALFSDRIPAFLIQTGPIAQPPRITVEPDDVAVAAGSTAVMSVTADGVGLVYRWQRAAGSGAFADVAGGDAASLSVAGAALGDDGARFRCLVSDDAGAVVSRVATLSVHAGTGTTTGGTTTGGTTTGGSTTGGATTGTTTGGTTTGGTTTAGGATGGSTGVGHHGCGAGAALAVIGAAIALSARMRRR